MKKISKILFVMLLVLMTMTMFMTVTVNASGQDSASKVEDLFNGGTVKVDGINNVGKNIISVITTIGIIVAVIVLLILGIKYMMGSASEKAEYKKTMIPYLVGAVLIFGASAIAKAVIAMSESITA